MVNTAVEQPSDAGVAGADNGDVVLSFQKAHPDPSFFLSFYPVPAGDSIPAECRKNPRFCPFVSNLGENVQNFAHFMRFSRFSTETFTFPPAFSPPSGENPVFWEILGVYPGKLFTFSTFFSTVKSW